MASSAPAWSAFFVLAILAALGRRTPRSIGLVIRRAFRAQWAELRDADGVVVELGAMAVGDGGDDEGQRSQVSVAEQEIKRSLDAYGTWRSCAGFVAATVAVFETLQYVAALVVLQNSAAGANPPLKAALACIVSAWAAASLLRAVVFYGVFANWPKIGSRLAVRTAFASQFVIVLLFIVVPFAQIHYSEDNVAQAGAWAFVETVLLQAVLQVVISILALAPSFGWAASHTRELFPRVQTLARIVQGTALFQLILYLCVFAVAVNVARGTVTLVCVYASVVLVGVSQFCKFRSGRAMVVTARTMRCSALENLDPRSSTEMAVAKWRSMGSWCTVLGAAALLVAVARVFPVGRYWDSAIVYAGGAYVRYFQTRLFCSDVFTEGVAAEMGFVRDGAGPRHPPATAGIDDGNVLVRRNEV